MQENEIISNGIGVSKLNIHIEKINPQCMPLFRKDTYKQKVLSTEAASFT